MTLLDDNTQALLAADPQAAGPTLDDALASLSASVVTHHALLAKARAYQSRVDRELAAAANQGATLADLAAAAGLSQDGVLERLRSAPAALLEPATQVRLGVVAAAASMTEDEGAHGGAGRTWAWPPLKRS